jgi:hypothetical protein
MTEAMATLLPSDAFSAADNEAINIPVREYFMTLSHGQIALCPIGNILLDNRLYT